MLMCKADGSQLRWRRSPDCRRRNSRRTFETRVEPANRASFRTQQLFAEEVQRHAQVRVVDEMRIQSSVARQFGDHVLSVRGRQPVTPVERQGVIGGGPLLDFGNDLRH